MENKNEMQSEERIDLEISREDVWDEQPLGIRDEKHLLLSIHQTRELYQREATSSEPKHAPAFYQVLDRLFEQFEEKIKYVCLPEPLPEPHSDGESGNCWSFAYEIENCGLKLSLILLDWSYDDDDLKWDIMEEFTLLNVPARLLTFLDYATLYGFDDLAISLNKRVEGIVMMNGECYISELLEPSDFDDELHIIYFD